LSLGLPGLRLRGGTPPRLRCLPGAPSRRRRGLPDASLRRPPCLPNCARQAIFRTPSRFSHTCASREPAWLATSRRRRPCGSPEAPFEIGIGPGTGDDTGPVGRYPVLLSDPGKIVDKAAGIGCVPRTPARALPRLAQSARPPLSLSVIGQGACCGSSPPSRYGGDTVTGLKRTASDQV
jgi:hypothetical protein